MSKKLGYDKPNLKEKQNFRSSSPDNEENIPFLPRTIEVSDEVANNKHSRSKLSPQELSSPNGFGYAGTKVSYIQEKKLDLRKEVPVPHPTAAPPPQKRESSLFSRPSKSSTKLSPLFTKTKEKLSLSAKTNPNYQTASSSIDIYDNINTVIKIKSVETEMYSPRCAYPSPLRVMERPTQHHTFPSDAADVRQIEKELLQLMDDFETGNLRAFGKHSRLRQMEEIREQQERLARLHFDVGAEQDLYPPLSEDGLRISQENTKTLMEKLTQLSESIESLHSSSHLDRKASCSERKTSTTSFNAAAAADNTNIAEPFVSHTNSPFTFPSNKNNQPSSNEVPKSKENRHPSGSKQTAMNSTFPKAAAKHTEENSEQISSHTIPKRNIPPNSNNSKPGTAHKKVAPPIPPPPMMHSIKKNVDS